MKNVTKLVNRGHKDAVVKIHEVEQKYNARYVGQLCCRNRYGDWVNGPADIFYQPTPPNPEYSNYFGLVIQNGSLYITSGASAVEGVINAVAAADGEIVYSRYRHDYRSSTDGSVWVDGGRDYFRRGSTGHDVRLRIIDGEWFQLEEDEE